MWPKNSVHGAEHPNTKSNWSTDTGPSGTENSPASAAGKHSSLPNKIDQTEFERICKLLGGIGMMPIIIYVSLGLIYVFIGNHDWETAKRMAQADAYLAPAFVGSLFLIALGISGIIKVWNEPIDLRDV